MPDAKKPAINLLEHANENSGRRLGDPEPATDATLDELSDDDLKEQLRERGLEVRKARSPRGVMAKPDPVRGTIRLTVDLPADLRKAIETASTETNKRKSEIAEEAFRMWMEHNNLGN